MADDVIGVQNVGNKVIVENVGAKRILGTQLIAQAKIPNWMFYITDIDSMAVFANQGTDVWIGAFGHAVAGSTTLRLGLSPFEGQKFYDLDLLTAFTFTGGAWNGGAIKGNLLSPTDIILDAPTTLTRGRAHVIAADGNYSLPSSTNPLEDTLEGHHMEVYVERGLMGVHIVAPGVETFIDDSGSASTDLLLGEGGIYTAVFNDGKWEIYYFNDLSITTALNLKMDKAANLSDVANAVTARTNLDVFSTTQINDALALKLTIAQNLADLANVITARANLGVRSLADQDIIDATFVVKTANLSDLSNAGTSRTNLDVYSKGETDTQDNLRLLKTVNLSDVANVVTSRTNLGVRSAADQDTIDAGKLSTAITIGTTPGVLKAGGLAADTLTFGADFANVAEAADPGNTTKVINPSHIPVAVSEASRSSEFSNITGLLPKVTEVKFLLVENGGDANKVDYPEFSAVFNSDPFLRTIPLVSVTVPAAQIALPNSGGLPTSHFVKVNSIGVVSLSLTKPSLDSLTEIFLGVIVEVSGDVGLINNGPWLASSESVLRSADDSITGGIVTPSATAGKVKQDAINFMRESVNWEQSTVSPHINVIAATDPTSWTYLDRFGVVIGVMPTDEVDGNALDDATNVPNNSYSIQVMYISSEGVIAVLKGQVIFSNLTDALAAVESYQPTIPTLLATTLEISRWIVRGNQFPGSGSLDLTDDANFQAVVGTSITAGTISNNAVNIVSSNALNTLSTTNLQTQVDELSERSDTAVATPSNVLPADAAIDVSTTPTLTSNAFAIIAGTYGQTETHLHTIWEIATDVGFTTIVYNSGASNDLVSHVVPEAFKLASNLQHFMRTIHVGTRNSSVTSAVTSFTTLEGLAQFHQVTLYTGNGTSQGIVSGLDFSTETGLAFIKDRDISSIYYWIDTLRGLTKVLDSTTANAEITDANGITSFNVDGFTVGSALLTNRSTAKMVAWQFLVNAGFFDIVQYVGTGVAHDEAHSLGVELGFVIIKDRNTATSWPTYHRSIPNTDHVIFDTNTTKQTDATVWDSTTATSSVFRVGTSILSNANTKNYIAYCFAHNPAKGIFCGMYTGTGAAGNKQTTGFPVGLVLFKSLETGGTWSLFDNIRNPSNPGDNKMALDLPNAEAVDSTVNFLIDGFDFTGTSQNSAFDFMFIAVADPATFS